MIFMDGNNYSICQKSIFSFRPTFIHISIWIVTFLLNDSANKFKSYLSLWFSVQMPLARDNVDFARQI